MQMAEMHEIDAWLNKMSGVVKEGLIKYPELAVISSYMVSKILVKASQINHLYVSWQQEQPDVVTIGEILHNGHFGGLHPKSFQVQKMMSYKKNMMRIELKGKVRDHSTHIFKVNAFYYVSKSNGTLIRKEYTGKQWALQNDTNNCVKGVEQSFNNYIETSCDTEVLRDSRLKLWKKMKLARMKDRAYTTRCTPKSLMYCFGQNITMTKYNLTLDCPPYPFAVEMQHSV